MLRMSNSGMKLTSQGYHFDENGKKFVRIFTSLNFIKLQVKIPRHKEMHIKSISVDFPYVITDNWVEITFPYQEMLNCKKDYLRKYIIEYSDVFGLSDTLDQFFKDNVSWTWVANYIDNRLKEIWFV